MKMVPLNFLTYLYCIIKNTISNVCKPKPKKTIDKRKELKEVRKRLKVWYDKQDKGKA